MKDKIIKKDNYYVNELADGGFYIGFDNHYSLYKFVDALASDKTVPIFTVFSFIVVNIILGLTINTHFSLILMYSFGITAIIVGVFCFVFSIFRSFFDTQPHLSLVKTRIFFNLIYFNRNNYDVVFEGSLIEHILDYVPENYSENKILQQLKNDPSEKFIDLLIDGNRLCDLAKRRNLINIHREVYKLFEEKVDSGFDAIDIEAYNKIFSDVNCSIKEYDVEVKTKEVALVDRKVEELSSKISPLVNAELNSKWSFGKDLKELANNYDLR